MVQFWINILGLVVAAILFGSAATPAFASQGACLDNRDVQAAIASHQIKTWPAIKAMAGVSENYKEVGAVRVCDEGGEPYYVVNVAGPTGESKQLRLNAVTGAN